MKIKQAYYQEGGITEDGVKATPHVKDRAGRKTEFLIRCSRCYYGLCKVITVAQLEGTDREAIIFVEPCPKCMRAAKEGVPINPLSQEMLGDKYKHLIIEREEDDVMGS